MKVSVPRTFSHIDFDLEYPRLDSKVAPVYQAILSESVEHMNLGIRIAHCGIGGLRLDCDYNPFEHTSWAPITCGKRTCPNCAIKDLQTKLQQYSPIESIAYFHETQLDIPFPKKQWRVRFWTLTSVKSPGDLKTPYKAIKKAFQNFWDRTHGKKSKEFGGPFPDAGAIFCLEIQDWMVHLHGLVYGPYWSDDPKANIFRVGTLKRLRELWSTCITNAGWSGERISIDRLRPDKDGHYFGAITETLAYPLRPSKKTRKIDQELLANIELCMFGERRYFLKGSWYNHFSKPKTYAPCPECLDSMHSDDSLDHFKGDHIRPYFFTEDETGFHRWSTRRYKFPNSLLHSEEEKHKKWQKEMSLKFGAPTFSNF